MENNSNERKSEIRWQPDQRQCPFLKEPFAKCHCVQMNSMNTEAAIYYCGGSYAKCDIYRKHAKNGAL